MAHSAHLMLLSLLFKLGSPSLQVSELEDSLREQATKLRQSDMETKKLQQELRARRQEASEKAVQLRQSEAQLFRARSEGFCFILGRDALPSQVCQQQLAAVLGTLSSETHSRVTFTFRAEAGGATAALASAREQIAAIEGGKATMAGRITQLSAQLTRLEEQLLEADKARLASFAMAA